MPALAVFAQKALDVFLCVVVLTVIT